MIVRVIMGFIPAAVVVLLAHLLVRPASAATVVIGLFVMTPIFALVLRSPLQALGLRRIGSHEEAEDEEGH